LVLICSSFIFRPEDGPSLPKYENLVHRADICIKQIPNVTFDNEGNYTCVLFRPKANYTDYDKRDFSINVVVFQPPTTDLRVSRPGPVKFWRSQIR
jgi:hypothetical protein